jgi:hypothetical protein
MKKIFLFATLVVAVFMVSSCLKDKLTKTYIIYEPVYREKSAVLADIKSSQPQSINSPGKIYTYGNFIFLNDINKGVHVIDNTNPSNPVIKAFINIPGNVDIAVKGNMLYADLYTDMVSIDISNPLNARFTKLLPKIFPERYYGSDFINDTSKVIVDWTKREVTERYIMPKERFVWSCPNCEIFMLGGTGAPAPSGGMGGSLARFAIVNNYLYAVNLNSLNIVDISTPADPVKLTSFYAGNSIETIYPFNNTLFLGSSVGMFIYDISNPVAPVRQGSFRHATLCDPVVSDANYVYITLRSGNFCQGTRNELDVVNVQNILAPTLTKIYGMTNPYGLAKDGNVLFICDGKDGLKVYNTADPANLQLIKHIPGKETYDAIANNNKLILVAKDGLYQYDYTDAYHIQELSRITINR